MNTTGTTFRAARPARAAAAADGAPPVASARAYLRDGLPAIYHDNDFGVRFVGALETLLDPIVAMLDTLPAYVSADLAPADMLVLVAAWLGVELRDGLSDATRRDLVRHAAELHRRRGTAAGLELALRIALPGVPLRVQDAGGVSYTTDPDTPTTPAASTFVVYCDEPLPEYELATIARLIEAHKPAHVTYRLRVKTAPPPAGGGP